MDELLSWATSKGVAVQKLHARGRQFITTEDVQAGDTLISIPQELLLYPEALRGSDALSLVYRQLVSELNQPDGRHALCVLLIMEKAKQQQSDWYPYMDILPDQYDDPYWWSQATLDLLRGTRLGRAVEEHRHGLQHIVASVNKLHELFRSVNPNQPCILSTYNNGWALTLDAARWARSVVWSRSFTVRMMASGQRNVVAMVPVLDMIDHNPDVEVVWHTGKDGNEPFQFIPLSPVPKGTAMSNNYGRKSSEELLLAYGFLTGPTNPSDHFVVHVSHSRTPISKESSRTSAQSSQQQSHPAPFKLDQSSQLQPLQMLSSQQDARTKGSNIAMNRQDSDDLTMDAEVSQVQQQVAEDLQRILALATLDLDVQYKLNTAHPLPFELLYGAQVCLMPPTQLYLLSAKLNQLHRQKHLQQSSKRHAMDMSQGQHLTAQTLSRKGSGKQSRSKRPSSATADVQGGNTNSEGGPAAIVPLTVMGALSTCHAANISPGRMGLPHSEAMQAVQHPAAVAVPCVSSPRAGTGLVSVASGSIPALPGLVGAGTAAALVATGSGHLSGQKRSWNTVHVNHDDSMKGAGQSTPQDVGPSQIVGVEQGVVSQQHPQPVSSQSGLGARSSISGPSSSQQPPQPASQPAHPQHATPARDHSTHSIEAALLGAPSAMHIRPHQLHHHHHHQGHSHGHHRNHVLHDAAPQLPPVHVAARLQALTCMKQQLQARLEVMVDDAVLQHASRYIQASNMDQTSDGALMHHTSLAVQYVQTQKRLVRHSMEAVAKEISKQVHDAAEIVQAATQRGAVRREPLLTRASKSRTPASWRRQKDDPSTLFCSIDADVHIQQYTRWLQQCGLQSSTQTQTRQRASPSIGADMMDCDAQAVPNVESSTCKLQEVVYVRTEPTRFLCRRSSSREVITQQDVPPVPVKKLNGPSNGKRAPSASRTFTMKGREAVTGSGSSQAAAAGEDTSAKAASAGPKNGVINRASGSSMRQAGTANSPAIPILKRVSLPQGLSAAVGIDSDHDPVALGVLLSETVQRGQELLRVPVQYCLHAATKEDLICEVMMTAHRLLVNLLLAIRPFLAAPASAQAAAELADGMAAVRVGMMKPSDMLVWHLMHTVATPPGVRISNSDLEGVSLLLEMLEDSPASGMYEETFHAWSMDHEALRMSYWRMERDGVPLTTAKAKLMSKLLDLDSSRDLYYWAAKIVDSCATEVHCTTQPSSSGDAALVSDLPGQWAAKALRKNHCTFPRSKDTTSLWVVAPVVCSAPCDLRDATMCVSLQRIRDNQQGPSSSSMSAAVDQFMQPGPKPDDDMSCVQSKLEQAPGVASSIPIITDNSQVYVVVTAECELQSQLPLSPLVILPELEIEEVMATWGPEALPWQQLLHTCKRGRLVPWFQKGTSSSNLDLLEPKAFATGGVNAGVTTDPVTQADRHGVPDGGKDSAGGKVVTVGGGDAPMKDANEGLLSSAAQAVGNALKVPTDTSPVHASVFPCSAVPACTVMYELYVCPGDKDQDGEAKLQLLAAAGLGSVHYLTDNLATEDLVMCALKLCLADQAILSHPIAKEVLAIHEELRLLEISGTATPQQAGNANAGSTQQPQFVAHPAQQQAAPSTDVPPGVMKSDTDMDVEEEPVDVGACGTVSPSTASATSSQDTPAGVEGAGKVTKGATPPGNAQVHAGTTAGVTTGGQQIPKTLRDLHSKLIAAQHRLFDMLHGLPDDYPVCKSARKQLRQMVHDARKNTHRRLRQLEAVHNVVSNHSSTSARSASYGVVGSLGGSYHALGGSCALHEGVRLYLQMICDVLDTWADHLGLNRSSDSMNKRHKTRTTE